MAAILMICMVSFVFCTGMRGDMSERIPRLWGSTGPAVIQIDGRSISRRDLENLRTQRNLANIFMKHCADMAFKNVSKRWFEESKNVDAKDEEARRQRLGLLFNMRSTLSQRKAKLRYFDGGVKFDDLVEFKLWQAEADRLGINIQDEHLVMLFASEFFITRDFPTLSQDELFIAQREAQRENRDASDAFVRRAVAEEFRVKIAQYAILEAQPFSLLFRKRQQGGELTFKFAHPDVPDEVRAPMTLAQLWDFYKTQRAEFNVSLIPVHVDDFAKNKYDFAKKIEEPNEIQKKEFFEAHKNERYDPTSDKWSLEIPPKIKIEYVMADPTSGPYFDLAKALLERASPFAWNPMQSPITTAATYAAKAQANKLALQRQLETLNPNVYRTTPYTASGSTTSILAWMAKRHPQAGASVVAGSFLSPMDGFGSLAGYLAWGTKKVQKVPNKEDPADGAKVAQTNILKILSNDDELEAAIHAELRRRAPVYADFLAWTTTSFPLNMAGPFLAMDLQETGRPLFPFFNIPPTLPVEAVQTELQDMIARRTAEEWAQANILVVKEGLKQAGGDADKFRRELRKHVKEMKLTYGPPDNLKGNYYDQFTINGAAEFDVLKQSYLKYMDQINLFEGRDLTPGKKLKAADYYKVFFDQTESFAASAKYQAKPWPPEVKPNNTRELQFVDARMKRNVAPEDLVRFEKHLLENDPNRASPPLYLYKTAERPILFWRTAEINAIRLTDYDKIVNDLKTLEDVRKTRARLATVEKDLKTAKDKQAIDKLKNEEAELKKREEELKRNEASLTKAEPELKEILSRVTDGWKFERARKEEALPAAQKIAALLINNLNNTAVITEQAGKLKKDVIVLANLSQMQRETVGNNAIDYFPPSLPKDKIVYPRDDMVQQVLSLFDLKKPIETGNKDLDEINKDLYQVAKQKQRDKDKFAQILADKPRSIYYVAVVTSAPKAEPLPFLMAMAGASYPELRQDRLPFPRDYFVDRTQEQEAKLYRAEFIRGLGEAHNFKIVDPEGRKGFDDRGD
jgi:hypothetical protein